MKKDQPPVLQQEEILKAAEGALVRSGAGKAFRGITTDSRSVSEGNLFIALIGDRFDGHDFLANAAGAGAAGLLIRKGEEERAKSIPDTVSVIAVDDTLEALGDIARFWRRRFSVPVLAITGSTGKTTTKEMAAAVIGREKELLKNEGNFNNLIGLPLTLFRMNETHEAAILEMGTNQRGEIARLTQIAEPTLGLVTNAGAAHLEGLRSVETVREEKGDLYRGLGEEGIAVVNGEDGSLSDMAKRSPAGRVITYGIGNGWDVRAGNIRCEGKRFRFDLTIGVQTESVLLAAPGMHNIYNALSAAAASWCMGIRPDAIRRGLEDFRPVSGRMEIIALSNGAFLINDTYNANPESVEAALRTLEDLRGDGASTVVLGDMLELGGHAERLHDQIGGSLAEKKIDRIFLRGDFARIVAQGAEKGGLRKDQIKLMDDPREIAEAVRKTLGAGDWVLIKGSRRMKMEEVAQHLIAMIGIAENATTQRGV